MTATAPAMEKTIAAALAYILSMQAEDGSWTEWALPPGSSATWTTAYVGYKLRDLPLGLAKKAARGIAAAARWLSDRAFPDGGWGYNQAVGPDADSTAYAILFLASAGLPAPAAACTMLSLQQRPDGGFATYPPIGEPNSWNISHPDVTPLALLALRAHPDADRRAIQRGIDYVFRQKTSRGLWNSFWWGSPLYGTEASLSLLYAAGFEMPSPDAHMAIEPNNAFEMALLISCLLYSDRDGSQARVRKLLDTLIQQQRDDGSWDTAPILRITRRDCYEPWSSEDAGVLYAEPNRLFTTAAALHALARYCHNQWC